MKQDLSTQQFFLARLNWETFASATLFPRPLLNQVKNIIAFRTQMFGLLSETNVSSLATLKETMF